MNKPSLDNQLIAAFLFGMVALFASLAFEANRNGMTDPVVAVHTPSAPVVAQAQPQAAASAPVVVAANATR